MATREQIIHDNNEATKGLSLQERSDIKVMAQAIKHAILNSNSVVSGRDQPQIAYTALLNVMGDLIATFFPNDEAERVRIAQTLIPMYVAAYRQKEKRL